MKGVLDPIRTGINPAATFFAVDLTQKVEYNPLPSPLRPADLLKFELSFYANEGNEPIHVHCRKADMECKYWLNRENFDLEEAFSYDLSPKDNRQIRKIIYEHFEYIEQQWDEF